MALTPGHRPARYRCTSIELAPSTGDVRPPRATASGPAVTDLVVDGPHALLAGTTGAGKSELLQTLIASLAAANRPDALNFVLIDYKGGAAFRECAALPHTVGLVTDLDGHLTERALVSLQAELQRRERLLAAAGAKDLDDYHRDPSAPTIARLCLIIDEFRVLAEELPGFVDGLVRLATVGRSLGVHLVLATQRPAGIVSADIRANVNLRIALRVRDDGDSQDVIDTMDAARIPASSPDGDTCAAAVVSPSCSRARESQCPRYGATASRWVSSVDLPSTAEPQTSRSSPGSRPCSRIAQNTSGSPLRRLRGSRHCRRQ